MCLKDIRKTYVITIKPRDLDNTQNIIPQLVCHSYKILILICWLFIKASFYCCSCCLATGIKRICSESVFSFFLDGLSLMWKMLNKFYIRFLFDKWLSCQPSYKIMLNVCLVICVYKTWMYMVFGRNKK